nr:MAG TPA: hypothetical protein [Crassvirales sp.]
MFSGIYEFELNLDLNLHYILPYKYYKQDLLLNLLFLKLMMLLLN